MDELHFEWDDRKNKANQKKYGISFEEARTAFLDESARVMPDPDHSVEWRKSDYYCWGSASSSAFWSFVTATGGRRMSFVSFRPEKPQRPSDAIT